MNNIFTKYYDTLFGNQLSDLSFFKYFIEKEKGPALEIGSGTGRLLLPLLQNRINIEGIEPNEDMLNICIEKAKKINISPKIYKQKLQNLNLNKKYKTIFMPLFVFQNIIDRNEAFQALSLCFNHLEKDGQILITTFIPWNDPTGTWEQTWRLRKTGVNENLILSESVSFDKFEQIETKFLKLENYELNEFYIEKLQYRYYSRFELEMMLEKVGFAQIEVLGDYINQEADAESSVLIFKGKK